MSTMSSRMEHHPDIQALQAATERAAWTPTAQGVEALSILAGLFLAASPWIVGFQDVRTIAVNNLITGVAFALLAFVGRSAFERTHGMSWAGFGIGVWTIIAPWVVAGHVDIARVIWTNTWTGGVAAALALAMSVVGASRAARR